MFWSNTILSYAVYAVRATMFIIIKTIIGIIGTVSISFSPNGMDLNYVGFFVFVWVGLKSINSLF
ncbi:MAG: hypothetical protein CM15mP106_4570 [Candidatus Neomarinimicrobiota bacterium]|nr:MAG: hypothetical protein CM15mP106_4570 [Candidatus Neomarinimicrobiota bacterium]